MEYLTVRIKQKGEETTSALSEFHTTQADAESQYWTMVANDIGDSSVTAFADFVIDTLGNTGKLRYYERTDTPLRLFYHIKIETYTEESGKNPVKEIREYADRDSAEIAYCKDNAKAVKDATILTGAHLVVNSIGGRELFELYDNRPLPEPEDPIE